MSPRKDVWFWIGWLTTAALLTLCATAPLAMFEVAACLTLAVTVGVFSVRKSASLPASPSQPKTYAEIECDRWRAEGGDDVAELERRLTALGDKINETPVPGERAYRGGFDDAWRAAREHESGERPDRPQHARQLARERESGDSWR